MGVSWLVLTLLALQVPAAGLQAPALDLRVTLIGNAGVQLSDGDASLLVDLPYESGAFGYQDYDDADLSPTGTVVSVITHDHVDHFDPALFEARDGWRVIGPPSVTERVDPDRVIAGDSIRIGAFAVVAVPSPHTSDHRSYRIRWSGRVLHFTGDTEDPGSLAEGTSNDVLFITPWLSCALVEAPAVGFATRSIAYHLQANGGDRVCGPVERLEQGSSFDLAPGRTPGSAP